MVTLVAGRSVCVSAFVCLPLGQIFGTFFADLGFRGIPWGHIKGTRTLKIITLVSHLAAAGPRDRFLVNLECILGAILDTFSHTGGHLWQLLLHFGTLFSVMFLVRFRVPALGGPMWLKHCKYCIRMKSPMLGKGWTLDQFWTTFGTLLGHFWHRLSLNGCPCRGLENHAILGPGWDLHVPHGFMQVNRVLGGVGPNKNNK